jgi:hypothetical protein
MCKPIRTFRHRVGRVTPTLQDLAYARWAKCKAPYVQLEHVDLDGRITFKISNEGPARDPAMPRRSRPHGARPRRHRDAPSGLRSATDSVRRPGLARDVLHDRDGALADERDRNRMGADARARDAAGGVMRGVEEG